jgi:hypothetical protein
LLQVPGIFACDPVRCAAKAKEGEGKECPLDSQAQQVVSKLQGFFEWAKADPKIAGFNPWVSVMSISGFWYVLSF